MMWWISFLLISPTIIKRVQVEEYTSPHGVKISFVIPEFEQKEVPHPPEGTRYIELSLPGAGITYNIGRPNLPVIRKFVEIPEDAEISIEARVLRKEIIKLAYPVYPKQAPVPKVPGYKPKFTIDRDYYARDEFLPKVRAQIIEIGEIRGHRVAVIEVYPIQYNPAQGKLCYSREIEIEIGWTKADWGRTHAKLERYSSPFYENRLNDLIINYGYYKQFAKGPPLPIGYLIITPDSWYNPVLPLAEWKLQKGYYVTVAKLSQTGPSNNEIRNYIINAYNNWPVPPTFVLLVGDVNQIGYWTGGGAGNPSTDLNYSLMDGSDYWPDIDCSRFSIADQPQLDSLVDKSIKYEKNEWTQGTDWCKRMYFIASSDASNHGVAEGTHQYCMQIARAEGVICDSIWLYYGTGTPIPTAINDGRAWVMYSGHGSTDRWADPGFTVSNVHALTNTDKPAFVGTYACLSGDYTAGECFSESWIRAGRRAGIAHFASSTYSYWDEDDILQRKMFDAAFDSELTWVMGMLNESKLLLYAHYGDTPTTQRYFEMYNMMGDGSIDAYWDIPHTLTVNYPSVIPIGSFSLDVTVTDASSPVEWALVCAKKDTIFPGYTNSNGEVTLNVFNPAPCTLTITVTGHNLKPFFGECQVIGEGAYVMYKSHKIDDSAGNNNGCVEPGESIGMPVVLENMGTQTAFGVEGTLGTNDGYVTGLSDTVQSYGNIAPGDTGVSSGSYKFTVSSSTPNGHIMPFGLKIVDDSGNVWIDSIHVGVGVPVIVYNSHKIDDSLANYPDGHWEPGEIVDLILTLKNEGVGNATSVEAKLRTNDPLVSIIDSTSIFGDIPATTIKTGDPYTVSLDQSTPANHWVKFGIYITGTAFSWTDSFSVQTGGVMYADHDIGNVRFTVTCQGICGFNAQNGSGSGFLYPNPGTNWLHIGSVWAGNSASYVVNRDYTNAEPGDWVVEGTPDGKVRMGGKYYSDQDGWAMYNDAGHSSPKDITITQKSCVWQDAPYNDFVIMQYTLKNEGTAPVNGIYVGQFMDFDMDAGSFDDNSVATDSLRRFVYEWSNSHTQYTGVRLLDPQIATNLSAVKNQTYVWPNGYVLDSNKIKFLNEELNFPTSDGPNDWSVVASAGPFDLGVGDEQIVAFAIIGGDNENDAKYNSDQAQIIYDSIIGVELSEAQVSEFFDAFPNPFTKSIAIRLQCSIGSYRNTSLQSQRVSFKIYDLAGRLVRTLLDKPLSAYVGTRHGMSLLKANVVWDGKDTYNRSVPSGIYFCRVEIGQSHKLQKIILLR